ncbi:porin family protein [Maribacter sp. 1_MG-2023]|uniref:porin family protein n=1 Tax=Maribacter sp. 1_MG-2023 TaxID=3062677 RepID=UPI0026E35006|nr:porin family protein [Maribacter sp. 1_MG-2023]MDO6472628.1 porin family protein [Maribacter sp. 1_MG-2023]
MGFNYIKKMRKVVLHLALIICFTSTVNAQAALFALVFGDKVATENFNIGLEIGFPYNSISSIDDSSPKLGLNFGISGNIKLSENWIMSPNIYFLSRRNLKTDSFSLTSNNSTLNDQFINVPTEFSLNYIDVPIFFNYIFTEKSIKLGLAPQISFRTDANGLFSNEDGEFDFNIKNQTEEIDYGFLAQLGYILGKDGQGKEIHLQLRYYQGLANVFKTNYINGSNKVSFLSLHISVPFIKSAE